MKGRSHRLQSSDPPDDWVDESWTVDCLCGVTFDDGEEMVNCDECGVWVHTRCSRYVKGDDNFVCDKCKRRNSRNDSEETEVAQLLVELPTKPVRMESSFPPPPSMPARRPLRLWTDIPIEERVHVQGIPGGDPALFGGLSSVFTPELWKSTGYVPKKFNFQYREFPCWDKKEEADDRFDEDSENAVDKGAGVLFSLLNESVLANPVAALVGMRSREGGYDKRVSLKETKRWDKEVRDLRCAQSGGKKERSLLRPMVLHTGKRKKDDLGTSKDRIAKKRARAAEKEADARKRGAQSSKSVFTPSSDAKQLEFSEDRGPNISKADVQSMKYKRLSNSVVREPATNVSLATDDTVEKHSSEALLSDRSKRIGDGLKEDKVEDKVEHQVSTAPGNMTITKMDDAAVASLLELNDASRTDCLQEQGDSTEDDNVNVKPPIENVSTPPEVEDQNHCPTGDRSIQCSPNGKTEDHEDISRSLLDVQSSLHSDAKDLGKCSDQVSESAKDYAVTLNIPLSSDQKVQSAEKTSEAVDSHTGRGDAVSGDCQPKRESEGLAGSITLQKCSSDVKHGSKLSEDLSKAGGILNSAATPGQLKTASSAGKSSTVPCMSLTPKSSTPQNLKSGDVQNPNPFTKQRVVSESKVSIKKDRASSADMDHDKDNMPRKSVKEHLRSPTSSALKTPHFSRNSHDSVSKRTTSESKDSLLHSSSKTLSEGDTAVPAGSSEKVHGQNKSSASSAMQRGEKLNQTTSSKTSQNHAPPACPPAPSSSQAKLSDEELALLLHQELNSSPRVPRVPRARHASSLPQLASPTAASMLIKRTSSSSGKDHNTGSRRKVRDAYKDGVRSSRELDDEAKKMDRVPSSPDRRRQDTASTVDAATKREENASSTASHSYKKTIPSTSIPTASSGRSSSTEANDRNLPSVRSSPRNVSDDDTGAVGPVHHTLPGLINEIMSKGRRMTYEELCNAVMPHWHNLRKHNGERYAYTSPSQAVLDCLRNRHEWARLVDRGPKTNPRKKRRPDADDSEDNEYGRVNNPKELDSKSIDTQREDFPKGKRKARKRRRLALHGRGIKDVREKQKTDLLTDDDVGPSFSNSTEETVSEDDNQGGGAGPVGSEATSSSEEGGTS